MRGENRFLPSFPRYSRVLHRFLQRPLEMLVSDLQIVLRSDQLRVANPTADSMHREHKAEMLKEGRKNDLWVFCNVDGEHLKRRAVNQWLKRILKNADLPKIPLKNLRHTAATIILGRKWPLKTVADLLGHTSIQQTADTYGQFAEGIHQGAVADLGEAMTPTLEN